MTRNAKTAKTATPPKTPKAPKTSDAPRGPAGADDDKPAPDGNAGSEVEGEGSYSAARRHRKSVETFVEEGRVDEAAREAEPDSAREAEDMERAEKAGRERARGSGV
jgi:hypothetical protein